MSLLCWLQTCFPLHSEYKYTHTHTHTDVFLDKAEASCTYSTHTRLALSRCATRNFCPRVFLRLWLHTSMFMLNITNTPGHTPAHAFNFWSPFFFPESFSLISSSLLFALPHSLPLISTFEVKCCHLLCSNQTHMVWWVSPVPAAPQSCTHRWLWMCVCVTAAVCWATVVQSSGSQTLWPLKWDVLLQTLLYAVYSYQPWATAACKTVTLKRP